MFFFGFVFLPAALSLTQTTFVNCDVFSCWPSIQYLEWGVCVHSPPPVIFLLLHSSPLSPSTRTSPARANRGKQRYQYIIKPVNACHATTQSTQKMHTLTEWPATCHEPKHVVERAILHHQNNNRVNLWVCSHCRLHHQHRKEEVQHHATQVPISLFS